MTPNQIVLRDIVGVATTIAAITTLALWWGGASRQAAPATPHTSTRPLPTDPVELGARLYETKGCVACHSNDGSPRVGPSFAGSWGQPVVLGDGLTIVFDEAYVRESLAHPQAQARPGYPPSMPSFDGMLREREIDALVAYIRSLAPAAASRR